MSALGFGSKALKTAALSTMHQRWALRDSRSSKKATSTLQMDQHGEKSQQQMRDEALGFLSAETVSEDLELQLRKAMREAEEAESRAGELRASFASGKLPDLPRPLSPSCGPPPHPLGTPPSHFALVPCVKRADTGRLLRVSM